MCWGPCVFCGLVCAMPGLTFVMLLIDMTVAMRSSRLTDCEFEVCDNGGRGVRVWYHHLLVLSSIGRFGMIAWMSCCHPWMVCLFVNLACMPETDF